MGREYKLIRSDRKTLAINITGGELIVKAPRRMSVEHIESFIAQKETWIARKLAEYGKKSQRLASVIDGSHMLYHGEKLAIVSSANVKRVAIAGGEVLVPIKFADDKAKSRAVISFFKRTAAKELAQALQARAQSTGLGYKEFATTNARTKWGSCDGDCNIRLNWRLVMLDAQAVDYVIVHELCHTLHHDHSAAFWAAVGNIRPSYKSDKKRLKEYSVLTTMYRD